MSVMLAGLIAALSWMAAMTTLELSVAYPFMSLTFAAVLVLSAVFLGETINLIKVSGVVLITLGVAVSSRAA